MRRQRLSLVRVRGHREQDAVRTFIGKLRARNSGYHIARSKCDREGRSHDAEQSQKMVARLDIRGLRRSAASSPPATHDAIPIPPRPRAQSQCMYCMKQPVVAGRADPGNGDEVRMLVRQRQDRPGEQCDPGYRRETSYQFRMCGPRYSKMAFGIHDATTKYQYTAVTSQSSSMPVVQWADENVDRQDRPPQLM